MGKELFFALVIICTVTHINRSVYEILKHKQILKPGKLSFVIMFANMMLLWISWVVCLAFSPNSYVKYLADRLTGLDIDPPVV